MSIRTFEESDTEAVVALWQEVFGYSARHNAPMLSIQRKLSFQRELFFVAIIDDELVGTVMGGYDGHRGWIYSLGVKPSARRRGIGAALIRHVETALGEFGCPKVNLQIMANNADVVKFYEKVGYNVEERISMGKSL